MLTAQSQEICSRLVLQIERHCYLCHGFEGRNLHVAGFIDKALCKQERKNRANDLKKKKNSGERNHKGGRGSRVRHVIPAALKAVTQGWEKQCHGSLFPLAE